MHRRRWPLAGPRGGRRPWPQPRRGDGRECIKSASETAPALRGRPSAALAIRKIASELNLHLKRRRLTWVCASHTRARRRRRCSFLRIRLAALRWSSEQLRGHRRQLAGAAASQWVSDICSLPIPSRHIGGFIRWRVWRVGAEGCAGLFCVMHRRRWPLAGPRGGRRPWPQPRRGDGRECIESASETAPALRGRPSAALAIRKIACELRSASETAPAYMGLRFPHAREAASPLFFFANPVGGAPLEQRAATGSSPTAGRRRGKPMGIGHLLAPDSEPAHWWLYPLARVARGRRGLRWIILRNAPAALAACRAKGRSPTVAAAAAR